MALEYQEEAREYRAGAKAEYQIQGREEAREKESSLL